MAQPSISRTFFVSDHGFTLVEVMIAMLMAGIVGVAVYNTSKVQQDTFVVQDAVVATQTNLRAAMLLMARELRMVGYDPTGNANATITSATASALTATMDLNGDGDTGDSGENITYLVYDPDTAVSKLGRQNPTQTMPVAEYIAAVEFYYTLDDGSQTLAPSDPTKIRAAQVTVLAYSPTTDPKLTTPTTYTTPGGQPWTLAAGYRGRMATMTVQFRNMGL